MDQNAFILFDRIFDEVVNRFCRCVLLVKDDLILKIKPLESKIYHASAFPVIRHLLASTINYMRNLIGYDEFLVLKMKRK